MAISDDDWGALKQEYNDWFEQNPAPNYQKHIEAMWSLGHNIFEDDRDFWKNAVENTWNEIWLKKSKWTPNRIRGWARVLGLTIPGELFKNVSESDSNRSQRRLAEEIHGSKNQLECGCGAKDQTTVMETPSLTRCWKCREDYCSSHWYGERFNTKYHPQWKGGHGGRGEFRWICQDCIDSHDSAQQESREYAESEGYRGCRT